MSPCPICEREHAPALDVQTENGSVVDTTPIATGNSLPMISGERTAGPRNRWGANIRCSLPDHVYDSRVLIVDHNSINTILMKRKLEKFGLGSDTVSTPENALAIYQDDPMKYNIVVMDPMQHRPVTGMDVFQQMRLFERTNNVPPCFLIASDTTRSMTMNRNGLHQKVLDSGVDFVLPWYRDVLPLYDALAGIKRRAVWTRSGGEPSRRG